MDDSEHWVECETCPKMFRTERAADQHMMATGHYRNYCRMCDRRFGNENSLKMVGCLHAI